MPTFAGAALVTAFADRANAAAWCGVAAPHGNAMIVMYLLMSVFHSPAWLRRRPERAASAHGIDPDA